MDNNDVIRMAPAEMRSGHRTYHSDRAATPGERKASYRARQKEMRLSNIGVIDFETDPFDNTNTDEIKPFTACIYAGDVGPIIIWETTFPEFVEALCAELEAIPEPYTFYAHNGGKFDYMFLIHKLRGKVSFKGRGIMSAKLGKHELRDSFHIIPEKLANYKKDDFDYTKLTKANREKYRDEIIKYMINDCRYLLEIVQGFVSKFGFKISIGQAAMHQLKQVYKVATIGENTDTTLRQYFYGGRVECLAGRGHFVGDYNLYDVNSMYPAAMANFAHPISNNFTMRTKGGVGDNTVFIDVTATNYGALIGRDLDTGETTAQLKHARFFTTKFEFEAALDLGLIEDIQIHSVIDCEEFSDFSKFVVPLYEARQQTKKLLKSLPEDSPEWNEAKKDDIFQKLLLNNAYGKFAQNPRRFKESYITEAGAAPPAGFESSIFPAYTCPDYAIWQRPSPNRRFNNVGTAASITGAARAILMRAINGAIDPIYCDTDSLICKSISGVEIHPTNLGAWDLEAEFSEVLIAGKKLYACRPRTKLGRQTSNDRIRSKGVSGATWADLEALLMGEIRPFVNKGVTLDKTGKQYYMRRNVRATAPVYDRPSYHERIRA